MENIILPDGSYVARYVDIAGQHWLLHFSGEGSLINKTQIPASATFGMENEE